MTARNRHTLPWLVAVAVLATACAAGTNSSPQPTATPIQEPTPTATTSPEPTATPTKEPTPTADPTAAPTSLASPGGFAVQPHPEADALFLDRDECENRRDGYRVEFPDDWWTNTEIGRRPPCIWFSSTFYEVPDPTVVPEEIAITIEYVQGAYAWLDSPETIEEVIVGLQPAVRMERAGPQGEGGQEPAGYRVYEYVIQLGRTPEEGPNLVVTTSTEMGGDYDLSKAVMDRMMSTMEFFGTIQ